MKGLARCRKAAKLSQTELASKIGVGQSAIAAWETGVAYPSADKLPAIASALSCTIDELFQAA